MGDTISTVLGRCITLLKLKMEAGDSPPCVLSPVAALLLVATSRVDKGWTGKLDRSVPIAVEGKLNDVKVESASSSGSGLLPWRDRHVLGDRGDGAWFLEISRASAAVTLLPLTPSLLEVLSAYAVSMSAACSSGVPSRVCGLLWISTAEEAEGVCSIIGCIATAAAASGWQPAGMSV